MKRLTRLLAAVCLLGASFTASGQEILTGRLLKFGVQVDF